MTEFARGSEWRRWDLHVHTPASHQHQFKFANDAERGTYGDDIWEKFITELESVTDVVALGITDYFGIDGYKEVLKYRDKGRLKNVQLVMPNIELRLDIITEDSRRLNLHVMFSDCIGTEDIDDLLARMKLTLSDPSVPTFQGVSCTRNGLIQVGKTYSNDPDMDDIEAYRVGCTQAVVDSKQVLKELSSTPNFRGNYLVIGVEDSPGGLSEIPYDQSGHLRTELYRKCDIMESANENTINFWLGKSDRISPEELIQRFERLKPCIHGSDAHSFDRLCKPDEDRFCWIKADPTFEGLKQIVHEPEERVRIQAECPTEGERKLFIESASFVSSTRFPIAPTTLPLNKNLVAIIGGRGSGKSALTESIAFCFDKHAKEPVNRKLRFIPYFERTGADFEICLSLGDRDANLETYTRELRKQEEPVSFPLEYLGQNRIEEFAAEDVKIHELVSNSVLSFSSYSSEYGEHSAAIEEHSKALIELSSQIRVLKERLSLVEVSALERDKAKKEKEKGLLSSLETQSIIAELDAAKKRQSQAQSLQEELKQTISDIELFSQGLTERVNSLWEKAKDIGLGEIAKPEASLEGILAPLRQMLSHNRLKDIEDEYRSASDKAREKLQGQQDVSVEHIGFLSEEIDRLSKGIADYEDNRKELQRLIANRNEAYLSLVDAYHNLQACYQSAIEEFVTHESVKGLLEDVTFAANLQFKADDLYEQLFQSFVDKRKCRTLKDVKGRLKFTTIEEYCDWLEKNADREEALDLFYESSRDELLNLLFRNHLQLTTRVSLRVDNEDISLENLSLGHKGTVVLKLFLATANCPIIFDQPEDHLDNNFIFSTLVPTFIEAKKKRQVIVVTHNANLVVNGDAEQVIVASYNSGKIRYKCGSIENTQIRDEITSILEGGQEAFERREHKYGFVARMLGAQRRFG